MFARMRLWYKLSGSFRVALWTPSVAACQTVERWHSQVLQRIVNVFSEADESAHDFCKRRSDIVSARRERSGIDVRLEWALCLARWLEH